MGRLDKAILKLGVSINGGTPKRMVYKGKYYESGWFKGPPIYGNTQLMIQAGGKCPGLALIADETAAIKPLQTQVSDGIRIAMNWLKNHGDRQNLKILEDEREYERELIANNVSITVIIPNQRFANM